MTGICGDDRFRKAKGELFHKAGRRVWLVGDRVTVNPRPGEPFGKVIADSMFPDEWVSIEIWNKVQFADYFKRDIMRQRMASLKGQKK